MYVGHAALALLAKAKRRDLSIALLVPVAWAPDWIAYIASRLGTDDRMWSHSLVSVGIGATVVALAYFAITRSAANAQILWLTYASHWPADYITGSKPTWPGGPRVGRMLYLHNREDFLLESALVLFAALVYWTSLEPRHRKRSIVWVMAAGLIGLQVGFEVLNGRIGFS